MELRDEQIQDFKLIYEKQFGINLADDDAIEKALKVLRMVELVYTPMTKEESYQVKQRRTELATHITKKSK